MTHKKIIILIQIYVYPIKSLRGIPLSSANLTAHGLVHDRRFMLLRRRSGTSTTTAGGGEWENMLVGKINEMALFRQQLRHRPDDGVAVAVVVSFGGGGKKGWEGRKKEVKLEVALEPDTQGLELIDVVLHGSGTKAYRMGERYDRWFSECFGYEVSLFYFPLFFMLFFLFFFFLISCRPRKKTVWALSELCGDR